MIKEYIRKPRPVRAVQWSGENIEEVQDFTGSRCDFANGELYLSTQSGPVQYVLPGSYIVEGRPGDFYPVGEQAFAELYRPSGVMV